MCTRTLPKHTHAQTRIRTHTYSFSVCLTHTRTRTHERTLTRTHTHSLRLPAITNGSFVLYIQAELFLNEHRQQEQLTTSKFRLGNPRRIFKNPSWYRAHNSCTHGYFGWPRRRGWHGHALVSPELSSHNGHTLTNTCSLPGPQLQRVYCAPFTEATESSLRSRELGDPRTCL